MVTWRSHAFLLHFQLAELLRLSAHALRPRCHRCDGLATLDEDRYTCDAITAWAGAGWGRGIPDLSIGAWAGGSPIVAPIAGLDLTKWGAAFCRYLPARSRSRIYPPVGRSNWQVISGPGCTVHYARRPHPWRRTPRTSPLGGLIATAQVVVNRTADSGHTCFSNFRASVLGGPARPTGLVGRSPTRHELRGT